MSNEHEVAQQIATGALPSPSKFGSYSFVAMRVTGTGAARREALNETCFRDPAIWLNPEMLERLNGVPVIVQHPEKAALNSAEFAKRAVGTIQYPYVADTEGFANQEGPDVWCVARIYDDAILKAISEDDLSTSPAVIFRPNDGNETFALPDGTKMLLEGNPSQVDHLAICELGVWDKGAGPSGIRNDLKDTTMAENTGTEHNNQIATDPPDAKNDADVGQKLDKLLSHLDSFSSRLDALEGAKKVYVENPDGDGKPGDGKVTTPDSEGKVKQKGETKELAADDEATDSALKADAQVRADAVMMAHGERAPAPLSGERLLAYRARLARQLQRHCPSFAKIALHTIKDMNVFDAVEQKIYADALAASATPDCAPGTLRQIVKIDPATGQRMITFHSTGGHTFISEMKRPARRVTSIRTKFD